MWSPTGAVAFPVAVLLVWRLAQLAALAAFGWPTAERQVTGLQPEHHPSLFMWDGAWYHHLLHRGYEHFPGGDQQPTSFFPLLPWLTKAVLGIVRSEAIAVVLVTHAAAAAALISVHGVVRRWKDERVARWTVVLLVLFPSSHFLVSYYSESLLIACSAGALWAFTMRRPAMAGVLAGGAAIARPPGILVAVVLVVAHLLRDRRVDRAMAWYALAAVGLGAVVVAQAVQAGDGLAWTSSQAAWGRSLQWPWTTVTQTLEDHVVGEGPDLAGWAQVTLDPRGGLLDLAATYLFLLLSIGAFVRPFPVSGRMLLVAMTLAPLAAGLTMSMTRLVLAAWPGFAVLASPSETRAGRWAPWLAASVFLAGNVAVLHDWSTGLFVG